MSSVFNLEKVGAPLFEAVGVDALKKHMRVSHSADDDYIGILSVAAREQVEKDFNIALVGQEYNLHLENGFYHFYYLMHGHYPAVYNFNWAYYFPRFHIPIEPVSKDYAVTITYTDLSNTQQTFNSSNYVVKYWKSPPEVMLLPSITLPSIAPGADIIVNFTAGFVNTGAVSTAPKLLCQAIQLLVAAWYEQREPVSESLVRPVPLSYDRIKQIIQVKRFW